MSEVHDSDATLTTEAAPPEPVPELPDIATIAASLDAELPVVPATNAATPWWPYFAYLGVWIGAAGAAGWFLSNAGRGDSIVSTEGYAYSVVGGIGLTLAGPALSLVVFLATYVRREPDGRKGLLSGALVRGAVVTFAGVAVWWAMLLAVDAVRLGRPW